MSQDNSHETSPSPSPETDPAGRTYRFLQKSGLLELSSNSSKFNQWVNSLDYDQFQGHLGRLNGLIRGIPIKNRSFDGSNVRISNPNLGISFLPVTGERKDALLRSVFTGLKNISNPSDAGLLLYLSIQAIHPFADGNGRTGRLLYSLFSHSGQSIQQEDILPFISHPQDGDDQIGRHKIQETIKPPEEIYSFINDYYLAPKLLPLEFLQKYGKAYDGIITGGLDVDITQLSSTVQEELRMVMSDNSGGLFSCRQLAMISFLSKEGRLSEFQYSTSPRTIKPAFYLSTYDKNRHRQQRKNPKEIKQAQEKYQVHGDLLFNFDAERMLTSINDQQAQELIDLFNQVKQGQVEGLIDTISHPNQFCLRDGTPLKDCYFTQSSLS